MGKLGTDAHSYANFNQAKTSFIDLSVKVDFSRKIVYGYADLHFDILEDNVQEILLDTKNLAIESAYDLEGNQQLAFTSPKNDLTLGLCLQVPIRPRSKGSKVQIRVYYSTTPASAGIQWFEPSQTAGKKHPYMYTQCEAILARTLLPCQDVPAVKAPYHIKVTVPSPLVAACSGTSVRDTPIFEEDGSLTWEYNQVNPIPAYLIAIVAGALKKASVGPRSSVWCEKELLDASVKEFSEETEKFIVAGEEITGMKYEWGVYDMVVLPAAFPYGGMENPNLTFLSASLLAGDRSLTNVVAHEITHSWAGNYTTNSTWADFWLNEGFTVYIERMILGQVHNSSAYRDFESLVGYYDLIKTVDDFGNSHEFTKLIPNMDGIDPDEAFSKIPYEKGSLFLRYLETKVGGIEPMQRWLKTYFHDFRFKSLDTNQMKSHFLNYFSNVEKVNQDILSSIDWNTFLYGTGLPPFDPTKGVYDKSLSEACDALAQKWIKEGGAGCSSSDISSFRAKQKMYFLDILLTTATPMDHKTLEKLVTTYELDKTNNVEILFRYLMLCLKSNYLSVIPQVKSFLSKYGRGLYVKPLYKAFINVDHSSAHDTYHSNKSFYHSIMCHVIEGMLKK